jgi:hypothetical protein
MAKVVNNRVKIFKQERNRAIYGMFQVLEGGIEKKIDAIAVHYNMANISIRKILTAGGFIGKANQVNS